MLSAYSKVIYVPNKILNFIIQLFVAE
jgi:hypothetical protein